MWPVLLDMTKDECQRTLRRLELEAYGNVVSALRAQGGLNYEKNRLLQQLAMRLNIPQERHRAEIRRAVNDERLTTIAHCMTGDDTSDEWALEGRRLVPIMPRLVPQTAYSVIADEEANKVSIENEKLPLPAHTERKRSLHTYVPETSSKTVHFRVPCETSTKSSNQNNIEDIHIKKRKTNINVESSSLAQHLIMSQPKVSKVQQLYRQKTKALLKTHTKRSQPVQIQPNIQKLNIMIPEEVPVAESTIPVPKQLEFPKTSSPNPSVSTSTTNDIAKAKTIISSNNQPEVPQKPVKICPTRRMSTTTTRTQTQPQKVILVSTSQGTTSNILQRTLNIPVVKTISMKNLEKVKVLNNAVTLQNATGLTQKPKMLTVQTKTKSGTIAKQVSIPFIHGVQLQALQNKGTIKMVPISTKNTKPTLINIVNSNALPIFTTANSTLRLSTDKHETNSAKEEKQEDKSSVLVEIMKASGVITDEQNDIENQITQLTEIPNASSSPENDSETVIQENSQDVEQFQRIMNSSPDNYVILQENAESSEILLNEQQQSRDDVVELIGTLDPETGMYSVKAPKDFDLMSESNQTGPEDSYIIGMESLNNSDLDMPSLS